MIEFIFLMILLVVFVEAITEVFVSSSIFEGLRDFIGQRSSFLGELVHCGYCTSIWVSASVAWMLTMDTGYPWLDFVVVTFVLHRFSNLFHELTCKWMNRAPLSLTMHTTESVLLPDQVVQPDPPDLLPTQTFEDLDKEFRKS